MATSIKTKIAITSAAMSAAALAGSLTVSDRDMSKILAVSGLMLMYVPGKHAVNWLLRDEGSISKLLRRNNNMLNS